MLKKLWKDPVWAAVISAGIVAAVGTIGTYVLGLWPEMAKQATVLSTLAVERSQWSNWHVWGITVLAFPSVLLAIALLWNVIRPTTDANDWRQMYMNDELIGLRWRWTYFSDGSLGDVHSFCPHCDDQVFPRSASAFSAVDRISFHCDSCNSNLATFEETYESLESRVRRLIQQKIRTGSWQAQK